MEKQKKCPKCMHAMPFEDSVCPFCGYEIRKGKRRLLLLLIPLALLVLWGAKGRIPQLALPHVPAEAPQSSEESQEKRESWLESLRPLAFWLPQHIDLSPDSDDMIFAQYLLFHFAQAGPSSRQEMMEFLTANNYVSGDAEVIIDLFGADYALQARLAARELLEEGGYSRQDLEDVLENRGYTEDQIHSGLEDLNADWKEQAYICGQDYLEVIPFSYQGLISQLEHHGFTHQEAVYAADESGADWKGNAVMKAQEILIYNSQIQEEDLRHRLEFQKFTQEEIEEALSVVRKD